MDFSQNIKLIYGVDGARWLDNLSDLVATLAAKWCLRDLVPVEDLSYNYVMSGWRNDLPVILKMGVDPFEIHQEYLAILAFNGHGLIRLLEFDRDRGAILITRAVPGKTLVSLFHDADDKALGIACSLANKLHQAIIPADHKFPLLSEWFSIIDKNWELPAEKLELARNLKNDLVNNSKSKVLLHGDLHYANILSDGNTWVVIDPKGVIGDPLYDMTGCLLREPFTQMMQLRDVKAKLKHRMAFVAEYLKTDIKQIWAWTYIQSIMSICWSLEDGQDVSLKRIFLDVLEESCAD